MDNLNYTKQEVETTMQIIEENAKYFESVVDTTVTSYAKPLDDIMARINKDIIEVEQVPLNTLEKYFFELSNCLYFMGEKLEKLGVYDSLSSSHYKEVYNTKYLGLTDIGDAKKKPTVAELTASAENETLYENVVSDIYSKAYRMLRSKVEAATTMLNCISKIISKRMTEMQLNSTAPSGRQILNENIGATGDPYVINPSSFSYTGF